MKTIGEIGHIYASNLNTMTPAQDPQDYWFQSINLLSYDFGAFLLDRLTTREVNEPAHGLFCISSAQTNALMALWENMQVGPEWNSPAKLTISPTASPAAWAKVEALAAAIINKGPFWSFQQMFTTAWDGGPIGQAFRDLAKTLSTDPTKINEIVRQDPIRYIVEMITFRQNIFEIIVAAQVLGKDGVTVMAEKRALVTMYRDSYTSKSFMRSFKWLSD